MRIGLYLGSFDPIHIGHVAVMTAISNSGLVDTLKIIPAWKNVWKNTSTSYQNRCEMITNELVNFLGQKMNITISDIERSIASSSRGYHDGVPTSVVISDLIFHANRSKDDLVIFTTKETLTEIPQWENPEVILSLPILTVGTDLSCDVSMPQIDISSTKIRQMIKVGETIYPFVSAENCRYIREHKLYD